MASKITKPELIKVARMTNKTGSQIVTVCLECGIVDGDRTNPDTDVKSHVKLANDPAYRHHDRTGHSARSFSVDDAPDDIQEMVKRGDLSKTEIQRVNECFYPNFGVANERRH